MPMGMQAWERKGLRIWIYIIAKLASIFALAFLFYALLQVFPDFQIAGRYIVWAHHGRGSWWEGSEPGLTFHSRQWDSRRGYVLGPICRLCKADCIRMAERGLKNSPQRLFFRAVSNCLPARDFPKCHPAVSRHRQLPPQPLTSPLTSATPLVDKCHPEYWKFQFQFFKISI